MSMSKEELSRLQHLCEEATPPPWHYYPYGEKSNDCILGVAVGEDSRSPPAGRVELHPYDEEAREFEMDKYILEPAIASAENHANYADFAFMAEARGAVPALLGEVERLQSLREARGYEVVCLCGSTRFADQHAIARWEFEQTGKAICLMINYLPGWYANQQGWEGNDHFGEASGTKSLLDDLHLRKIDLADRVHVINVDGYIGESTRREIEYAEKLGKPVTYLVDNQEDTQDAEKETQGPPQDDQPPQEAG